MTTWKEEIISALEDLGGEAHLDEICAQIRDRAIKEIPVTLKQTVSRVIQDYSKSSLGFKKTEDIFYTVNGIGKGVWGLNDYLPNKENVDLTEDDIGFPEGKKVLRQHIYHERNARLVREAKKQYKDKSGGKLCCEVCDFDFQDVYGELGEDYIEAHHTIPVSEMKQGEKTKIEDLAFVCSNCHRMLHRRRPWLTKEQLKNLLVK